MRVPRAGGISPLHSGHSASPPQAETAAIIETTTPRCLFLSQIQRAPLAVCIAIEVPVFRNARSEPVWCKTTGRRRRNIARRGIKENSAQNQWTVTMIQPTSGLEARQASSHSGARTCASASRQRSPG